MAMAKGAGEASTSAAALRLSTSPSPGSSVSQVSIGRPRRSQVREYFEHRESQDKSIRDSTSDASYLYLRP